MADSLYPVLSGSLIDEFNSALNKVLKPYNNNIEFLQGIKDTHVKLNLGLVSSSPLLDIVHDPTSSDTNFSLDSNIVTSCTSSKNDIISPHIANGLLTLTVSDSLIDEIESNKLNVAAPVIANNKIQLNFKDELVTSVHSNTSFLTGSIGANKLTLDLSADMKGAALSTDTTNPSLITSTLVANKLTLQPNNNIVASVTSSKSNLISGSIANNNLSMTINPLLLADAQSSDNTLVDVSVSAANKLMITPSPSLINNVTTDGIVSVEHTNNMLKIISKPYITNIADVAVTQPSTNEVFTYDTTLNKWRNTNMLNLIEGFGNVVVETNPLTNKLKIYQNNASTNYYNAGEMFTIESNIYRLAVSKQVLLPDLTDCVLVDSVFDRHDIVYDFEVSTMLSASKLIIVSKSGLNSATPYLTSTGQLDVVNNSVDLTALSLSSLTTANFFNYIGNYTLFFVGSFESSTIDNDYVFSFAGNSDPENVIYPLFLKPNISKSNSAIFNNGEDIILPVAYGVQSVLALRVSGCGTFEPRFDYFINGTKLYSCPISAVVNAVGIAGVMSIHKNILSAPSTCAMSLSRLSAFTTALEDSAILQYSTHVKTIYNLTLSDLNPFLKFDYEINDANIVGTFITGPGGVVECVQFMLKSSVNSYNTGVSNLFSLVQNTPAACPTYDAVEKSVKFVANQFLKSDLFSASQLKAPIGCVFVFKITDTNIGTIDNSILNFNNGTIFFDIGYNQEGLYLKYNSTITRISIAQIANIPICLSFTVNKIDAVNSCMAVYINGLNMLNIKLSTDIVGFTGITLGTGISGSSIFSLFELKIFDRGLSTSEIVSLIGPFLTKYSIAN